MKRLVILFVTFLSLLILGCKTNIDSMIGDYNQKFTEDTSERDKITRAPVPGDDDFFQDRMLEEEYFIWEDATINLSGPSNCSCVWTFLDPENNNEVVPVHYFGTNDGVYYLSWKNRQLYVNIKDSGLKMNKVYRLQLVATSTGGNSYTDTTSIVIYKHVIN